MRDAIVEDATSYKEDSEECDLQEEAGNHNVATGVNGGGGSYGTAI